MGVRIVIIDEIGKMELFSKQFIPAVEKAFSEPNTVILATIPVPSKGKPITFVEKIREMPGAKLITVRSAYMKMRNTFNFQDVIRVIDGSCYMFAARSIETIETDF